MFAVQPLKGAGILLKPKKKERKTVWFEKKQILKSSFDLSSSWTWSHFPLSNIARRTSCPRICAAILTFIFGRQLKIWENTTVCANRNYNGNVNGIFWVCWAWLDWDLFAFAGASISLGMGTKTRKIENKINRDAEREKERIMNECEYW